MSVIIKKGENANHVCFDDVEKKSLDCHHQKGGECECMYTWFWWCQRRIKQGRFKRISTASRLIQDCFNKQSLASRFLQDQALPQNKGFQNHPRKLEVGSWKLWLQYYLFSFFMFLDFWVRQGCCPCSYVSSSAMRNLDLYSSLSLNVCVLNWFLCFWKIHFNCEQKVI